MDSIQVYSWETNEEEEGERDDPSRINSDGWICRGIVYVRWQRELMWRKNLNELTAEWSSLY